ncbi:MAG: type 1 glutamine amidotransferase [Thermodesulfovibrionales bacterium]|nr:type 1 glutamine amidotransferase [Thermodesulfovibrionales bacterium]
MSTLILKNIHSEGPGTIEAYLHAEGMNYEVVDLSSGERIPPADAFNTLVILGGPMSVNEADTYTYINDEIGLVKEFIEKDKKVLGICLGAQIIAKALGAEVYKGAEPEIGWCEIEFTKIALLDKRIRRLAMHPNVGDIWNRIKVFQWHYETFDLPKGAIHIASSRLYPNQAFRYKENTYAFQFHIEVVREMIFEWLKDEDIDNQQLIEQTDLYFELLYRRAFAFYDAFF